MEMLKSFWKRFKEIKHLNIIIAVLIALVLCVCYFSFLYKPNTDKTEENSTKEFSSTYEYVDWLENKLDNVLSKISGVGSVDVVLTLESGFSYDYAKDIETKTTVQNGNEITIKTENIILVSNEPVVVKEIYPIIKGVVVVAKGAENFSVKLNIIEAIQTVLEVEEQKITVLY